MFTLKSIEAAIIDHLKSLGHAVESEVGQVLTSLVDRFREEHAARISEAESILKEAGAVISWAAAEAHAHPVG